MQYMQEVNFKAYIAASLTQPYSDGTKNTIESMHSVGYHLMVAKEIQHERLILYNQISQWLVQLITKENLLQN